MQAAKDSFYIALRDRLVARDPDLKITVDGATRPAIVVLENEPPSSVPLQNGAFYLKWGDAEAAYASNSSLMKMKCTICYTSQGDPETGEVGRGRDLGALDADLLGICAPPRTHKFDYSSGSAVDAGSDIFWSAPELAWAKTEAVQVGREARINVFFYPEVSER